MDAWLRASHAVLRLDAHHRPVRGKWDWQARHGVQELVDIDDRRERIGDGPQERQRVSLLDEDALPMLLGALTLGDLDAQLFVRVLELVGALLHTAIELGVGAAQCVLALPQHSLGGRTLRDVEGVTEDVGRPARILVKDVAVHPHARASVARDHAHQAAVLSVLPHAAKVAGEEMTSLGREKLGEVRADAVFGLVAKGVCGGGIDGQQPAVQIVRADQTEAVIDEVAIPALALLERLLRLLPGRGDVSERTRSFRRHAPPGRWPSESPGADVHCRSVCCCLSASDQDPLSDPLMVRLVMKDAAAATLLRPSNRVPPSPSRHREPSSFRRC